METESTVYDVLACDVLKQADRSEWLKWRTAAPAVGASEVHALFGITGDKRFTHSQFSLWERRTVPALTEADAEGEVEEANFGNLMETPILTRWQAKNPGVTVVPWIQTEICIARDFPGFCTPDAIGWDDDGPLLIEVKAWDEAAAWLWAEGIPDRVLVQVQHQMRVTGIHRAVVVVMFGNKIHKLETHRVEFDSGMGEDIAERCERFARYVTEGVEPPVDGSAMTYDAVLRLHPDDNGETVELDPEFDLLSAEWDRLKTEAKIIDKRLDEIKNRLCAAIGDNTFGETPGGRRWSWKTIARKAYTVAEGTYRKLHKSA